MEGGTGMDASAVPDSPRSAAAPAQQQPDATASTASLPTRPRRQKAKPKPDPDTVSLAMMNGNRLHACGSCRRDKSKCTCPFVPPASAIRVPLTPKEA